MLQSNKYDYIFCGAGCAALSLLMRMIKSKKFTDKRILLIDKGPKTQNDRTWCFWETGKGFFEDIVYRRWAKLDFFSDTYTSTLDIVPYEYKMIRGIDLYEYCFGEIKKHSNIEIVYDELRNFNPKEGIIPLNKYSSEWNLAVVFNSIVYPGLKVNETKRLLQHFKGWIIDTKTPFFDPGKATLMDFRVSQNHGTTFCYVLPFSPTKALVEFTLFTKELLKNEEYDSGLKEYIENYLQLRDYTISDQEFGVIPMTDAKLSFDKGTGIYHIGTAGGQTKSSSGYTFQFIQKQSEQIVACLSAGKSLHSIPQTPSRFRFYDNTLLHILYHDTLSGKEIFTRLFKKNKPQQVLRFLDNESSFTDELKIISSLPVLPFLKAALKQL